MLRARPISTRGSKSRTAHPSRADRLPNDRADLAKAPSIGPNGSRRDVAQSPGAVECDGRTMGIGTIGGIGLVLRSMMPPMPPMRQRPTGAANRSQPPTYPPLPAASGRTHRHASSHPGRGGRHERGPSGKWSDDDFDMLADGAVVGRIFKARAAPVGTPWMWTLMFGHHEDRTPTHGRGHVIHGRGHAEEAVKAHTEEHGKK